MVDGILQDMTDHVNVSRMLDDMSLIGIERR